MADIAAVFHWSPETLEAMSFEDLTYWWQKARARHPGGHGREND